MGMFTSFKSRAMISEKYIRQFTDKACNGMFMIIYGTQEFEHDAEMSQNTIVTRDTS